MLHIPQDLECEPHLPAEITAWLAFAEQKLEELAELKKAAGQAFTPTQAFTVNRGIMQSRAENLHVKGMAQKSGAHSRWSATHLSR